MDLSIDEYNNKTEDENTHEVKPKFCGCKESKPCTTWERFIEWFETPL